MNPAVVIPAFTRVEALERLLASLRAADIPAGTPLVIAVDRAEDARRLSRNNAVAELARTCDWPHGPRETILHPAHVGLVGNVFFCAGMAERFGAVLLLEDDLVVSRRAYRYAQQAIDFFGADPRIAGISLNALWFNGFTHQPFTPLLDDSDIYFLQLSTPQGQAYTAAQWSAFSGWMAVSDSRVTSADGVHELFETFPPDDWLALKAKYLAATNRYYAYPRESLTTNFGEPGTHFPNSTAKFQVPMQHFRRTFRFQTMDEAVAVYDGFYELLPEQLNRLTTRLHGMDYDVDLNASKSPHQLGAEFTLTTRPCRQPVMTFGKELRPLEANVAAGLPGRGISLARREDVDTSPAATAAARRDNERYFARQPRQAADRQWQERISTGLRRLFTGPK